MSHLMEQKFDIAISGDRKYLACHNKNKIGKLGAEQFARKQQRDRERRRYQIFQYWRPSSSAGRQATKNCRRRGNGRSLSETADHGQRLHLWNHHGQVKRLAAAGGIVVVGLASLAAGGRCGRTKP